MEEKLEHEYSSITHWLVGGSRDFLPQKYLIKKKVKNFLNTSKTTIFSIRFLNGGVLNELYHLISILLLSVKHTFGKDDNRTNNSIIDGLHSKFNISGRIFISTDHS